MASKKLPVNTRKLTQTYTSNYRPSSVSIPAFLGYGMSGRVFDLSSVSVMLLDATVALGVAMLEAPLSTADGQWDIVSDSEEVTTYVNRVLHRFWQTSLPVALQCISYGYSASEALYKYDPHTGLIYFNRLRALYPKDVRVLTQHGEYAGLRIVGGGTNSTLATENAKIILDGPGPGVPAKGVWFYHGTHYNTFYGRSRLLSAWLPWRDKCSQDGAMDIVRMWYYRLAFTGPRVRHPERDQRQGDGTIIPARDMARQITEWIKVGAGITLPNTWDAKNNTYAWTIEDPKINGSADGLLDYVKWLDNQMTRGLLIPDNVVVEASASGGGGSMGGRKVPEDAFYVLEERLLHEVVTQFDDQILRPSVHLNFGKHVHYDIKMRPLTPARQQAAAEMAAQQGAQLGGAANNPQAIQGGSSDQADNAAAEAARNEGGTSGGRDNNQNRLALDMVDGPLDDLAGNRGRNKQTRDAFQYRESPNYDSCTDDGKPGSAPGYSQCATCSHYTGMGSCELHGPSISVAPTDSCRYYLEGANCPERAGCEQEVITPEESGLAPQAMTCKNCVFFAEPESACLMYREMNERCPTMYNLDEHVVCGGRCNLWKPSTVEGFTHRLAYDYNPEHDEVSKDPHESAKNILKGARRIFMEAHDKPENEHEQDSPGQVRDLVNRHAPNMNEQSWHHVKDVLNKGVGQISHRQYEVTTNPPIGDDDHKEHVIHHITVGANNANTLGKLHRLAKEKEVAEGEAKKPQYGKTIPEDPKEKPITDVDHEEESASSNKPGDKFNAGRATPRAAGKRFADPGEGTVTNKDQEEIAREAKKANKEGKAQERPETTKPREKLTGDLGRAIIKWQSDDQDSDSPLPRLDFHRLEKLLAKHGETASEQDWQEAAHWLAAQSGGKVSSTDPKKYVMDSLRDEAEDNIDNDMLPYAKHGIINNMFEEADEGKFRPEDLHNLLQAKHFSNVPLEKRLGAYGMQKLAKELGNKMKTTIQPTYKGLLDALTEWNDASKEGDKPQRPLNKHDLDLGSDDYELADDHEQSLDTARQIHEEDEGKYKAQHTADILSGRAIQHHGALVSSNKDLNSLAEGHAAYLKEKGIKLPPAAITKAKAKSYLSAPFHEEAARDTGNNVGEHRVLEHGKNKLGVKKEAHEGIMKLHPGAEAHIAKAGTHAIYTLHGDPMAIAKVHPVKEEKPADAFAPQPETKTVATPAAKPARKPRVTKKQKEAEEKAAKEAYAKDTSDKQVKEELKPEEKKTELPTKEAEINPNDYEHLPIKRGKGIVKPKEKQAEPAAELEENKLPAETESKPASGSEQTGSTTKKDKAAEQTKIAQEANQAKRETAKEQEHEPFTHWPLDEANKENTEQAAAPEAPADKADLNKKLDKEAEDFDPEKIKKEAEKRLQESKSVPKNTMESVDKAVKGALEKLGSSESIPMIIGLLVSGGFVLHLMKRRPVMGLAVGGSLAALLYAHAKGKHALAKQSPEEMQRHAQQAKAAAEQIETAAIGTQTNERNLPEDTDKNNPHPLSGARLKPEEHQQKADLYKQMEEGEKGKQRDILRNEGHGPYPDVDNFDYATINDPKRRAAALDAMKASKDLAKRWGEHSKWHADAVKVGSHKLTDKEGSFLKNLMDQSADHSTTKRGSKFDDKISNYMDAASVLHGNSPVAVITQSPGSPEAKALYKEAMNRGFAVVRHREVNPKHQAANPNNQVASRDIVVLGKPDHVSETLNMLSKRHLDEVHGKNEFSHNFRHDLNESILHGSKSPMGQKVADVVSTGDAKNATPAEKKENLPSDQGAHQAMDKGFKTYNVEPMQQEDHKKASQQARERIGPTMAKKAWLSIQSYHYAPTSSDLYNLCIKEGYDLKGIQGHKFSGVYASNGKIYFAGDVGHNVLSHVYAHEYMHAVDHKDVYSSQPEWQKAWQKEVVNNKQWEWENSRANAAEGFADFGRRMMDVSWEVMKERYPMCTAFFESQGLHDGK